MLKLHVYARSNSLCYPTDKITGFIGHSERGNMQLRPPRYSWQMCTMQNWQLFTFMQSSGYPIGTTRLLQHVKQDTYELQSASSHKQLIDIYLSGRPRLSQANPSGAITVAFRQHYGNRWRQKLFKWQANWWKLKLQQFCSESVNHVSSHGYSPKW